MAKEVYEKSGYCFFDTYVIISRDYFLVGKFMMKFEDLQKKIKELKSDKGADLSMEEDLSIAIMNLISLEEHFFFTAEKTKKSDYFDLLSETREIRKELMGRMIERYEGETWCVTKHLLAATMRVMEVGT